MKRSLVLISAVVAVALFAVSSLFAAAGPAGLAWDSVSKMAVTTDPSSLQPGSFDDDYAAASSVQPPAQGGGGGLFGGLKQSLGMAENAQQMMQTGMAQRHYVAGSKERTDLVALQTATITDCVARTITTLNLRDKTYRVVSMDQPGGAAGAGGMGGSAAKDDGTKIAIAVSNTALGARAVGGEQTNGYRSDMTFTETKPTGESHTQNADLVGYYTAFTRPFPHCTGAGAWSGDSISPGQGMAMMAAASKMMRELSAAGVDKRFSLTQSGPTLPFVNFSMFDAITFSAKNGQGATFVTERGHVRAIGANDPIFSIPSDFTQER